MFGVIRVVAILTDGVQVLSRVLHGSSGEAGLTLCAHLVESITAHQGMVAA